MQREIQNPGHPQLLAGVRSCHEKPTGFRRPIHCWPMRSFPLPLALLPLPGEHGVARGWAMRTTMEVAQAVVVAEAVVAGGGTYAAGEGGEGHTQLRCN